uniref:Uncharacterized protein n=1 Tax=viral metagenome TaxID=1070528 RepID=A0A6C0HHL9_9ZZZZ
MADKQSTTRIADLPENITMQMNGPVQQQMPQYMQPPQQYIQQPMNTRQPLDIAGTENNLTYTQMNVHPNPYGNPMQPGGMPLPQQPQQMHPQQMQQEAPQYRLPSRDIPRNTDGYTQDIETTANYIPAPKLTSDYIRDFQDDEEVAIKTHKVKKHRERLMDTLLTEIQIPIFIGILFFVFQMPLVDALIFKKFSFMRIYNEDGNFNFYGLFLKSILFGLSYFVLTRGLDFISSL